MARWGCYFFDDCGILIPLQHRRWGNIQPPQAAGERIVKLVELLARELGEWPVEAVAIVQNEARNIATLDSVDVSYEWNQWDYNSGNMMRICEQRDDELDRELAEDHATAIVTRADWEAERAKLRDKDFVAGVVAAGIKQVSDEADVIKDAARWRWFSNNAAGSFLTMDLIGILQSADDLTMAVDDRMAQESAQ